MKETVMFSCLVRINMPMITGTECQVGLTTLLNKILKEHGVIFCSGSSIESDGKFLESFTIYPEEGQCHERNEVNSK